VVLPTRRFLRSRAFIGWLLAAFVLAGGFASVTSQLAFAQTGAQSPDRKILIALEEEWLHAKNAATLNRILASDFVHVIPAEHFLSKQEHIEWFEHHPRPGGMKLEFETMEVRIYGETAIVNGIVVARAGSGKEVRRTAFTDVFVRRAGGWQAVNAQETPISAEP